MRQMRRINRQITDEEKLLRIIEECQVVRIGARDGEGMFIVPVNYGYTYKDGSLKLYIHSAREGRKADLFSGGADVAFEMDQRHQLITGDYTCSYSYAYQSIMGNGHIRLVESKEEKQLGLEKLMAHMVPEHPARFLDTMIEAVHVYCLDVTSFTGKERTAE